jgi:hypothetical protein
MDPGALPMRKSLYGMQFRLPRSSGGSAHNRAATREDSTERGIYSSGRGPYSGCLRLSVDVLASDPIRQRTSRAGFLWAAFTGRSTGHEDRKNRGIPPHQARAFGPGYNRSTKWPVVP